MHPLQVRYRHPWLQSSIWGAHDCAALCPAAPGWPSSSHTLEQLHRDCWPVDLPACWSSVLPRSRPLGLSQCLQTWGPGSVCLTGQHKHTGVHCCMRAVPAAKVCHARSQRGDVQPTKNALEMAPLAESLQSNSFAIGTMATEMEALQWQQLMIAAMLVTVTAGYHKLTMHCALAAPRGGAAAAATEQRIALLRHADLPVNGADEADQGTQPNNNFVVCGWLLSKSCSTSCSQGEQLRTVSAGDPRATDGCSLNLHTAIAAWPSSQVGLSALLQLLISSVAALLQSLLAGAHCHAPVAPSLH